MKLFSEKYTTPDGIEIFFRARVAVNMEILESWCYTRGSGAASILSGGAVRFPRNSRWCSAWLNSREVSGVDPKRGAICSREDSRWYDVLSYTSGAAGGGGVMFCLYQVKLPFCFIPGQITVLFIPGQITVLFYTRSDQRSVYTRWCILTHTSVRGAASAWAAGIYARRAIATAFAWLPSWRVSSGRWHLLWQTGIAYLQYCRRLGSAI